MTPRLPAVNEFWRYANQTVRITVVDLDDPDNPSGDGDRVRLGYEDGRTLWIPVKLFLPYAKLLSEELDEVVDHPKHYGGAENPYEAIKVIEAWELGFNLGNTVKYIARAGAKPGADFIEDLKKARWYLDREISNLERED